ncbi:hypothetical protein QJQ45_021807 [Haematococcus lacustris]|nr:hypothetical protein QJQ45_021807 [Haematococcus lacustris]
MQRRTACFPGWLTFFTALLSLKVCGAANVSAGVQLLPGLQVAKMPVSQAGNMRALRPPAPVPSPEASYEKADSREVLAQLFGPNTNAYVRAPVEPDTLFPIRPGMCSRAQTAHPKALHYHLALVACDVRQLHSNSAYYAALTAPGTMGCPELPLVVAEEDVTFAPGFNRQVSSAYKSALTLAGSEPFVLNLYRPSPVEQLDVVMQRLRDIQNRSGLFEDSWQSLPKEIPLASVQTGQRPVPGYQDIIILNLVHHRARCYGLVPVAGNTTTQPCHVMSVNKSLIQHTGTASALFGNKSTRFHVAEDFPVVHKFAIEDPEGTCRRAAEVTAGIGARSSQAATQPAASSEPGPSTPLPAKRSKRTKAEPEAAEPTQPTKGKGKGKGKAAKAKPAPQPGRWVDRDCNAALNMQRIGESRWRPLELCFWPDQGALPAKGKEYPGLGYKRVRDKPPKAQQQQQPAVAQSTGTDAASGSNLGLESCGEGKSPNGKRRRTITDDTAAGTTAGAATSSPRSSWITTQWGTAAEGRGNCLHCGEDRSMNNITRLKNHLLKCPQFLDSPAAQEAAGRCKEVKAAIAQRQQGNSRVTQQAVELTEQEQSGEDVMRLAIDNNWSFHFVEHATTQAFFEKWLPHLKLPSRWEVSACMYGCMINGCLHLSGPLLLGLYVKVLTEVKALVARCRYVTIIIDGWSKSLGSAHVLGVCAGLANQATVFLDVISTAGLSATSELMLGEVLGVIEKHGLVTELPSFRQHIDQVKEVVHYFLHLQLPRELLLQHRAATAAAAATTTTANTVSAKQVELVQMSQTRFASLQDMLCSVQHNKSALRSVAISDSLGHDARSRNVIALVLNPDFWEKNEWIVGTLAPAAKLVEALQADAANLAHVHFGQMAVEDKLDKITSEGYMVKMNLSPSIFHPRLLRDPVTWWEWYGKKTPVLQQVAQRVLSIPATSAGVERLFSVFKFIWSDRRSRLLMGRMWAMAYVYFNTRALKHQEQPMADRARPDWLKVIKAAIRGLVEAARPDLSPAQVDAVVAEMNKRMTMGSRQQALLPNSAAPAQLPPPVPLNIWDPKLLAQIKDAMELLTTARVLEHLMRGPHHSGIKLLPAEVAVFEQPSSSWPVAKLKELDDMHLTGDGNSLNANATTVSTSINEFYRHQGRFIKWGTGTDAASGSNLGLESCGEGKSPTRTRPQALQQVQPQVQPQAARAAVGSERNRGCSRGSQDMPPLRRGQFINNITRIKESLAKVP